MKKLKRILEGLRPGEALKYFTAEVMHPGQALVKYFIKSSGLTPDQVAKETRMPVQEINEIIEGKRAITDDIASLFERCFGWPAQALVDCQSLYDIEMHVLGHDTFLEKLRIHLVGQEFFLADGEARSKEWKRDGAFFKRRLHAKLRSRRRIRVPKK
jgi:addiction module HigA family antidote